MASTLTQNSELPAGVLTVPQWASFLWLWHGFSTRVGGVSLPYRADPAGAGELNLGFTAADDDEAVRENRRRFLEAVTGSQETSLLTVRQVHSNLSVVVSAADIGRSRETTPEADGMITAEAGLALGIFTADCIPVLVVDPVKRVVGAFHAGWRGTVERIAELGAGQMVAEFGCDPQDLMAAIGPGIGQCCYVVGGEVEERFTGNFAYAEELLIRRDGELRVDLVKANRRQLLDAGLGAESIAVVGGCTSCQPKLFFSHRASGGHAGRMMAVIGIRASQLSTI